MIGHLGSRLMWILLVLLLRQLFFVERSEVVSVVVILVESDEKSLVEALVMSAQASDTARPNPWRELDVIGRKEDADCVSFLELQGQKFDNGATRLLSN